MMNDMKSNFDVKRTIAPAAARTTTTTGAAVDLAHCNGALVVFDPATITDGTHTPSVTECDTSGGTYTAVAAADLIGTLAALATDVQQRVSYIGKKQFIKGVITVTGSPSTGGVYDAVVVRGYPRKAPLS